ncbi:hypothetical protein O1L44_15200 [Streptomyces noursei]|nr:hypothetical protein [Streptomyces noursei]
MSTENEGAGVPSEVKSPTGPQPDSAPAPASGERSQDAPTAPAAPPTAPPPPDYAPQAADAAPARPTTTGRSRSPDPGRAPGSARHPSAPYAASGHGPAGGWARPARRR